MHCIIRPQGAKSARHWLQCTLQPHSSEGPVPRHLLDYARTNSVLVVSVSCLHGCGRAKCAECNRSSRAARGACTKHSSQLSFWVEAGYNDGMKAAHCPGLVPQRGDEYVLPAIHHHSRYVEMAPVEHDSEAGNVLTTILLRWVHELGRKVLIVRADRAAEYAAFDRWCSAEGMLRKLSLAYTPEQIGRAERFNRTCARLRQCCYIGVNTRPLFHGRSSLGSLRTLLGVLRPQGVFIFLLVFCFRFIFSVRCQRNFFVW
jgi:transposase InsO family protein